MGSVSIDYDTDVVPLSPGGCPTERHIVRAYVGAAQARFPQRDGRVNFWAAILGKPAADVAALIDSAPVMEERVRSRLVKQGGVGYEPPTVMTFPAVDDFVQWVLGCGAIPMMTWLDGTSQGESDPEALLSCLQCKGVAAVNIIPDRNWNIADAAMRAKKQAKLKEFVETCERLDLPINIGTEMNRDGLPFVDDLDVEALQPYRDAFLCGARIMVGQSILARYADYSYVGAAAAADFGKDMAAKNRFFESVGALPPLTRAVAKRLEGEGSAAALTHIRECVQKGRWQGR